VKSVPSDPQYLLDQYETLRQEVLQGAWSDPAAKPGVGLALLLHRGMRAWLDAWVGLIPRPEPEPPEVENESTATHGMPHPSPSARAQLTAVLAGMVLACAQPQEPR
jgi:hypothetical protein